MVAFIIVTYSVTTSTIDFISSYNEYKPLQLLSYVPTLYYKVVQEEVEAMIFTSNYQH